MGLDRVKEALSGFHMPKMGRKKEDVPEAVATITTTTTSVTELEPVMAVAVAAPITAAGITAALRDSRHDEKAIVPPYQELTAAPAVITAPLLHKPAAPLIDEEHMSSISARKLKPLSVLSPSGSVMMAEIGTSTPHPTATVKKPTGVVQHPTVATTNVNAAVLVMPSPVTPVVAVPATTHTVTSNAHVTPIADSFKTKALHLAAAVTAPLAAAKDKLTGHHHDEATVPRGTTTITATTSTAAHPTAATAIPHPIITSTAAVHPTTTTTTAAVYPTTSLTSKVSHLAAAVTAPLVAAKDKLTGHHHDHPTTPATTTTTATTHTTNSPTSKAAYLAAAVTAPLIATKEKLAGHHSDHSTTTTTSITHGSTPSTATTAAAPESIIAASGRRFSRTSVEILKEQTVVKKKVLGKAPDDVAAKVPHNDDEEFIMVETTTTRTITTISPTHTHVYEPGGVAAAAAATPAVATAAAHVEKPVEVKHTEVKTVEIHVTHPTEIKPVEVKYVDVKPVEVNHVDVKPAEVKHVDSTDDKHASGYIKPVVVAVTGTASAVAAVFSGKKDSNVLETDKAVIGKAPEAVLATVPHKFDEEVVTVKTTTTSTTTTDEKVAPTAATHAVQPVIHTHVTKAAETVAAAVPVTGTAVDSIAPGAIASTVPHKDGEDVDLMKTTTTTDITPTSDIKGKSKHADQLPLVTAAPIIVETPAKPVVQVTITETEAETKEAKKERKKKEKVAKKAEVKKNKVPLKTKLQKISGPGFAAPAAASIGHEDPPIFTVTEDDVEKPMPILTKRPILTVSEEDVQKPSPMNAPHPVILYVAPKLVSTSALKVASAPRPMILDQPIQSKDIKLPKIRIPKVKVPKVKAPKMPKMSKLKKKAKVETVAVVVPETTTVKTTTTTTETVVGPEVKPVVVEPVTPVVILEVPKPIVETVTIHTVEPVVAPKPKPAPKVIEVPKPVIVEAPKAIEAPKPVIVETVVKKVVEAPKPVIVEAPKVVEARKPVVVEPPKPIIVESTQVQASRSRSCQGS
ncbi:hypothetical protein BGW39_001542 [Mortierella sp. 14UC]|nr:hypothetical protein BGW39_001542 [Mortierella sp. 14UC]